MPPRGLTDESFWDEYWASVRLPLEIKKSSSLLIAAITNVFDEFLEPPPTLTVLEIGGAPGQYSAYIHRHFGHAITVLDSSPLGCGKTRENFELLKMPAEVVRGDMFSPPPGLGRFDIVFSLGLIEHFDELSEPVQAHLSLLAPEGLLLLGVPNYRGINEALLRRLSPAFLSRHRLEAMDDSEWDRFEAELGLERLFREYIGGFEASTFWRCESRRIVDRALHQFLWYLGKGLGRAETRFLRRLNGRFWSGYRMGVYRAPT